MKATTIDEILTEWRDGSPQLAGGRVEEVLSARRQVAWARGLLSASVSSPREQAMVQATIDLASDPARWRFSSEEFSRLRIRRLAATEPTEQALLAIAEGVAKLAYNATGASAPFGTNVCAEVAARARELATLKAASLSIERVSYAFAAGLRFPHGAV